MPEDSLRMLATWVDTQDLSKYNNWLYPVASLARTYRTLTERVKYRAMQRAILSN